MERELRRLVAQCSITLPKLRAWQVQGRQLDEMLMDVVHAWVRRAGVQRSAADASRARAAAAA